MRAIARAKIFCIQYLSTVNFVLSQRSNFPLQSMLPWTSGFFGVENSGFSGSGFFGVSENRGFRGRGFSGLRKSRGIPDFSGLSGPRLPTLVFNELGVEETRGICKSFQILILKANEF